MQRALTQYANSDYNVRLQHLSQVLSFVSCISLLFPLITFLVFSVKRRSMERFSFFMCYASFGLNLFILMGTLSDNLCSIQALGTQYFACSLVAWWTCISYFLNYATASWDSQSSMTTSVHTESMSLSILCSDSVIVREIPSSELSYLDKFFHIIAWGIPLPLTLIAYSVGKLQTVHENDSWECWITRDDYIAQLLFFYGPLVFASIVGLLYWPKVVFRIYRLIRNQERGIRFQEYIRQALFVLFFFLYFLILIIFRVLDDVYQNDSIVVDIFALLETLFVSGTGIFCFLVFGVSWEIAALWSQKCSDCPCASATIIEQKEPVGYGLLEDEGATTYYSSDNDYNTVSENSTSIPLANSRNKPNRHSDYASLADGNDKTSR